MPDKKKILIVDDEAEILRGMEIYLENAGYEIVTVQSGQEALDKVQKEKFDLVILDVIMPEIDGFEVCRRLRHHEETMHIPIIFETAKTQAADRFKGMAHGAFYYITKPFELKELKEKIEKVFKRVK